MIATPSFFQAKQAILEMDAIRKFCFLPHLTVHCLLESVTFSVFKFIKMSIIKKQQLSRRCSNKQSQQTVYPRPNPLAGFYIVFSWFIWEPPDGSSTCLCIISQCEICFQVPAYRPSTTTGSAGPTVHVPPHPVPGKPLLIICKNHTNQIYIVF